MKKKKSFLSRVGLGFSLFSWCYDFPLLREDSEDMEEEVAEPKEKT